MYEGANKLQTVTNKNGKVTFAPIEYTEEGEHTYTVKEVAGNTPGITYDKTDKQVTVKVKKDGDNLKADVAYPDNKTSQILIRLLNQQKLKFQLARF